MSYCQQGRDPDTTPAYAQHQLRRALNHEGIILAVLAIAATWAVVDSLRYGTGHLYPLHLAIWLAWAAYLGHQMGGRDSYWQGWLDRDHREATIWTNTINRLNQPVNVGYHQPTQTPNRACICGDPNCDWT